MSPSRHSGTAWQLASGNKGDLQCDELRPLSPTPNRQSSTFNPLIQGSSSYSLRLIDFSFIHISVHHILINYHALNCKKTTIIAISSVYNGRSLYWLTFTPSFTLCNTKTTISNVQNYLTLTSAWDWARHGWWIHSFLAYPAVRQPLDDAADEVLTCRVV